MRTDSALNLKDVSFGNQSSSRSKTPNNVMQASTQPLYNPYPLYKQKIRTLLKPPDYSRNPPKFISSREPRSEFERKEASTQVKLLKRTFNTMYQQYNTSEMMLTILKSEAMRINALRTVGENGLENLQARINNLQTEENDMLKKIRQEFDDNAMCRHVRERMRQTLMFLEVKNQYLQYQIHFKGALAEAEHRKKIKTFENKFTKAQAFRYLSKTVSLDIKDRTQDLQLLKEDIKSREKMHELRKTRLKRYEEIAETAANEERDLKSNNMREAVLLSMLWAKQLYKRYICAKNKFSYIEVAFQKIKSETLLGDVGEIVTRFLLKENRFSELMNALHENKKKCLVFLKRNDEIESKVDGLLLGQKDTTNTSNLKLKKKLHENIINISIEKEKERKLEIVYKKIEIWVMKRIDGNLKEKSTLKEKFEILNKELKRKIKIFKDSPFITEL